MHQFCVSGDIDRSIATVRTALGERARRARRRRCAGTSRARVHRARRRLLPLGRAARTTSTWTGSPRRRPSAGVAVVKGSDFLLDGGAARAAAGVLGGHRGPDRRGRPPARRGRRGRPRLIVCRVPDRTTMPAVPGLPLGRPAAHNAASVTHVGWRSSPPRPPRPAPIRGDASALPPPPRAPGGPAVPPPPDAAGPPGAACPRRPPSHRRSTAVGVACKPQPSAGGDAMTRSGRAATGRHVDHRPGAATGRGRPGPGDDPDPQRRRLAATAPAPTGTGRSARRRLRALRRRQAAARRVARTPRRWPRPARDDDAFVWLGLHEPSWPR